MIASLCLLVGFDLLRRLLQPVDNPQLFSLIEGLVFLTLFYVVPAFVFGSFCGLAVWMIVQYLPRSQDCRNDGCLQQQVQIKVDLEVGQE